MKRFIKYILKDKLFNCLILIVMIIAISTALTNYEITKDYRLLIALGLMFPDFVRRVILLFKTVKFKITF